MTRVATRNEGKQGPSLPYIPSGSFAKAMLIEGADANASVTGNESTVPMQLRITGLVEMPNSKTYDATGCFVGLEAWGDVSSERAIVRTRNISCLKDGKTIDMPIIPLDREKGLFTSGIHVLDELSVRALSRDIMKQNRVTVHPEKSVPRTAGYSDAVSVLAQDRPSLAIVSGQGGAAGQRERVAELVMMAQEQGREVQIIAADRRSQMNLKQDERLSGELITGRRQLLEGMAFTPGSTVIVDQGEKLSLKETLQGNHYPVSGTGIFSRRSMPVILLCWAFWLCDWYDAGADSAY